MSLFTNADFATLAGGTGAHFATVRGKLANFGKTVLAALPPEIAAGYPQVYSGKSPSLAGGAWIALRRMGNFQDPFDQCNFSIEIDRAGLVIAAAMQNGTFSNKEKPIGALYDRLSTAGSDVIQYFGLLGSRFEVLISKRERKSGGGFAWIGPVARLDCASPQVVPSLQHQLEVIKLPGVAVSRKLTKDRVVTMSEEQLTEEAVASIEHLFPILCLIKDGHLAWASSRPAADNTVMPNTPYSNLLYIRKRLRACRQYVWWIDKHFDRKALELLAEEIDRTHVTELRILSGPANVDDQGSKGLHEATTRTSLDWH